MSDSRAGGKGPLGGCVLLVVLVAGWLTSVPARLGVDGGGIAVRYWAFRRRLPWSQGEEVLPSDRVDGFGSR
ncbi:PH domain-containing protein [Nocardiopsis coralliicola]